VLGLVVALNSTASAATVTIIDEEFTGGAQPVDDALVTWSDTTGGNQETYGSSGAGARDMNSVYDHDQDGGTPDITIPGGVEVNDSAGGVTLTAAVTLTLPAGEIPLTSVLTFYAGVRNGNGTPTLKIINTTDTVTLLDTTVITINANDNIWEYNSYSIPFSASDVGDAIDIEWFASGNNSSSGLQMADVELTIETIPEPATVALAAVGLLGLRRRRRRM